MSNNETLAPAMECRTIDGSITFCANRDTPPGSANEKKYFRGYAARFNVIADLYWFDEEIMPGAFSDTIETDDIRAVINHDPSLILGRNRAKTLVLTEDTTGLYSVIDPPDTRVANDLKMSVLRGDVSGMSFKFTTDDEKWIWSEDRNGKNDLRQIIKATLSDVSIVTYPAYDATDVFYRSELRSAESVYKSKCIKPHRRSIHYIKRYCDRLQGCN